MTPDEAAALLGVETGASASEIIVAYNTKTADVAGTPEEADVVQLLREARTTLMAHRQTKTAAERPKERSVAPTPEYGQRGPARIETTPGGWPVDEPRKGFVDYTPEQEERRKRFSLIMAIASVVLAALGWITLLLEPVSLFGVDVAIWAMLRVRGYGGRAYTGIRALAWVAIAVGVIAVGLNVMLVLSAFAKH